MKDRYQIYDDPLRFYDVMLNDISNAREYIYLETYKFGADNIGERFREVLLRKCREGIRVRMILDSWGTQNTSFFQPLIQEGAEIRFFKKIKIGFDLFTRNHKRNHRKIMVIDNRISYIGSANITGYSLNWREIVLRMEGDIALQFRKAFEQSYKIYNKYLYAKFTYKHILRYGDFEIVRDLPSIYRQQIKRKFEKIIQKAKKEVVIETPYFLPGYMLRKLMTEAAEKGVKVKVIIPFHSDVRLVDILRRRYLGMLFKKNVEILMYTPNNLHAKCLFVDNSIFSVGSPNFDYRSFRYQHEITIIGKEPSVVKQMQEHISTTLADCIPFDYEKWKNRPLIDKLFESLLIPFRHLF